MYPEWPDIIECGDCSYCIENAHYGECGDLYTAYCNLKDKPVDLMDGCCDLFTE